MELRRVAPVLGLCALLAADAVLIAWAFRGAPVEDSSAVASVRSTTSRPSPSRLATTASKPTPGDLPAPAPVERVIASVGPSAAWVVQAGTCTRPGTVYVTGDGGGIWQSHRAPGRVLRVRPASATTAFVSGGDEQCALRLWESGDSAATWGPAKPAVDAWSRMPDDPGAVHTPDDILRRPCGKRQVLDLVPLTAARAVALCDNGEVRPTTDRGVSWTRAFALMGSVALTMSDNGSGVMVRVASSCPGVVAVPLVGGLPNGNGVCVRGIVKPGQVSVSGASGAWWLVVGNKVLVAPEPVGPWRSTKAPLGG